MAQFDFEKPAARVWLGVHQRGIIGDGLVQRHDLAADGRIDVARGLHGFHHGAGFAGIDLATGGGQFHEHDVGQLGLRVVADADGRGVAADADPFVGFGVFEVGRNVAHKFIVKPVRRLRRFDNLEIIFHSGVAATRQSAAD
jgi:hypothetical protein